MKLHLWLTLAWALVGGGITLAYPDSIGWVAFMSLYANVVSHWGAYQAARAEKAIEGK